MNAKGRRVFTHADFARVERHLPWVMAKRVRNAQVLPHWIGTEDRFWYRQETKGGAVFVIVDAATGRKSPAFDHDRLAKGMSQATKQKISPGALPFSWFTFTPDLQAIDFAALGRSWRFNLGFGKPEPGQGRLSDAELPSPDGRLVAFLKGPDIWIREQATGIERALTTDGAERFAYGKSPDSNLTTITWKRTGSTPPPALLWSPDSRRVLTHRLDERRVRPLHLHQSVPEDGSVRPVLHEIRVPFPGDRDEELAYAHHLAIEVETGKQVFAEVTPQIAGNGAPVEKARVWWDDDGRVAWILDIGRAEKWFRLLRFDTDTGKVRIVREERGKTFVEPNLSMQERPNIRTLDGGKEIIWYSQEDGWAHLYLVDGETGATKNRITGGKWVVREILHVDPVHRTVLFVALGITPRINPYLRQVCLARLDGGPVKVLTLEPVDHQVATVQPRALIAVPLEVHRPRPHGISPSGRYFVETQSTISQAPVSYLRDAADGRVITTLEEADVSEVVGGDWRWPEEVKLKAADRKTDIYGAIWLPTDFDPKKRYPVLDLIYPGPQRIQTPHHSFTADATNMRQYLFPRAFAELGMIVVTLDGRGTPLRSKAFHDHWYGKMETAGGLEDHIAGLKQLAKDRPYMDLDRVGITGHSGGGFASTRALFQYPEFFKVAVSSSGNHDQRGYMAHWGEKYQGLMSEGVSYEAQVNASIAHRLEGKLMLAYADMDDNVPPALTLQIVDALIKANKDFDLLVMPNHNHLSIYRDGYFFRRTFEFFLRHLVGVEPEPGYKLPGSAG
jgi:dipeptidyl-peptidase-4